MAVFPLGNLPGYKALGFWTTIQRKAVSGFKGWQLSKSHILVLSPRDTSFLCLGWGHPKCRMLRNKRADRGKGNKTFPTPETASKKTRNVKASEAAKLENCFFSGFPRVSRLFRCFLSASQVLSTVGLMPPRKKRFPRPHRPAVPGDAFRCHWCQKLRVKGQDSLTKNGHNASCPALVQHITGTVHRGNTGRFLCHRLAKYYPHYQRTDLILLVTVGYRCPFILFGDRWPKDNPH